MGKAKSHLYAQQIISELVFANRIGQGVGIDTIRLMLEVPRPSNPELRLLKFKWQKKDGKPHLIVKAKNKNKDKDTYYRNIKTASDTIKLHWTNVVGRGWLSVEVSLAKFATGDSLHVFHSKDEILAAIDKLSREVSAALGQTIKLRLGHCSRIDLFLDARLDDKTVNDITRLAGYLKVPQHELLWMYLGTTRFQNYGKKGVTHELDFYNKTKKERKTNRNFPPGILRIESRYTDTQTIKRNAPPEYYDKETKTFDLDALLDITELEKFFDYYCPLKRVELSPEIVLV